MNNASMRIGVLHFSHETVTFLKNDTTREDFVYPGSPAKGEALLKFDPKSYMGGFVKMAREFDGAELVGIESPLAENFDRFRMGHPGRLRKPGVSRLRPSYAKRRVDHPLRLGRYLQIIGLIDAIFQ
jgi:hypothetical protein